MFKDMNQEIKYKPEKYWEERLNKNFSLGGVGHLGFSLIYNIWLYKAKLYTIRRILKNNNINCQGKKLLDIGVGTGFYLSFWEKLGVKSIAGIDITSKSIEELTKKYPKYKFVKANIGDEKLSINEKFDIISAFDVLFHIVRNNEFEQAIRNIKKFSHKDTIFLIMDNFLKEYKPAHKHESDRTLEYYKKILNSNFIKIEDIISIFYFMNTPIDIERIDSKFIKILINKVWRINKKIASYSKKLGPMGSSISFFWGLLLYYFDRLILKYTFWGPSTKLMLAKPVDK